MNGRTRWKDPITEVKIWKENNEADLMFHGSPGNQALRAHVFEDVRVEQVIPERPYVCATQTFVVFEIRSPG